MAIEYKFNKDLHPFYVGFDELDLTLKALTSEMNKAEFDHTKAPHYNIHRPQSAKEYVLEMNIPGYDAKDLAISLDGNLMTIKGVKKFKYKDAKHVFGGISFPADFEKQLRLADTLVVKTVKHENGVLLIVFENVVPDVVRKNRFEVGYVRSVNAVSVPNAVDRVEQEVKNVEKVVEEVKEVIEAVAKDPKPVIEAIAEVKKVIEEVAEVKKVIEPLKVAADEVVAKTDKLEEKPIPEVKKEVKAIKEEIKVVVDSKIDEVAAVEKTLDNAEKVLAEVVETVTKTVEEQIESTDSTEVKADLEVAVAEVTTAVEEAVAVITEVKAEKSTEAEVAVIAAEKVEVAATAVVAPKATTTEIEENIEKVKVATQEVADNIVSK